MEKIKSFGSMKIIGATVALILAIALLLSAFTGGSGDSGTAQQQTVYRENKVERGDITVGVTESATATLKTHSLYFDVTAEIDELYVKAGQQVNKGDAIALMSATDILEEISELKKDLQAAVVELNEADLEKQKGELEAKLSYETTVTKAESADSTYDYTVEDLEYAVTQAQKAVDDVEEEIRTYTTLLSWVNNYDNAYTNYTSAKEWYEDAQKAVSEAKKKLNAYDGDKDDLEYETLKDDLEYAQSDLAYAKLEYENQNKNFNKKYDTNFTDAEDIIEARDEAYDKLLDAQNALKKAEYNLENQTVSAEQTKEETVAKAEIAETTYQMELTRLANNVSSKTLAVERIQEQIDDLEEYLANNLLVAPCDGVVTGVNYDAGDEVNAGNIIATISDNANVFVYVSITQDDITNISLGQPASLTLDAFEELAFDGEVDSISTTPARSASGSASYNVTIRALGDTAQIYEGMTGSVTLITRQQPDVLYVSNRAVFDEDGVSYVKVKRDDESIEAVPVETGFSDGRYVEIVRGLEEGETYIIESQVAA